MVVAMSGSAPQSSPTRMTSKDRPPICPCPRTCTPVFNALALNEDLKTGDMSEGYSGECLGRMSETAEFTVGGVVHRNDLNRCVFTPLKGIIRFQENVGDWQSSVHVLLSALQVVAPFTCVACGEGQLYARFILIGDERLCYGCAVRLGRIEFLPENAGKAGFAKWRVVR